MQQPQRGYYNFPRRDILDLIPTTAKTILDLGCGAGALGALLKHRQTCYVEGIELNKMAAEAAQRILDKVWIDNLNRFCPCYLKRKYDCIVFGDILEHLIAPWKVLKNFVSVLEDDGVIIASIPNVAHPWVVSNLQKGLFRYEPAGLLDITHLRFFTKTTIFQLFYQANLKIIDIKTQPSEQNPYQFLITAVKPAVKHKTPVATILLLTCNGWRFTKNCINSIKQKTTAPYKILVIDNASTDKTISELRKDRSLYHIENTHNHGFARGFNLGLPLINTPYFVLSNNDIIVTQNWLSTLIKHIELDKNLVVLGPRSNHASGPQGISPVPYNNEEEMHAYAKQRGATVTDPLTYFFRIVFFCTLFKTEVLQRVGLLDENFVGGNFEDDDYCLRVAQKKLKAAYDNAVFIHHWGEATFKENKIDFKKTMERNKKILMDKWHLTEYGPKAPLPMTGD